MHLPVLSRAMPSLLSLLTSSSLSLKTPLKCLCPCEVIPESGWGPFSLHPVFLHGLSSGEHLGAGLDFSTLATALKPHHGGSYWSTSLSLLEILVNCQYKDYFFAKENWIILLLWCPFHLEVRIRLLRKRRTWWLPEDPGVEEFHSRWHLEDHLTSLPSLPFIVNPRSICSWVVRTLRTNMKWVLMEQIRTTKTTYNCKCKMWSGCQQKSWVSSALENNRVIASVSRVPPHAVSHNHHVIVCGVWGISGISESPVSIPYVSFMTGFI